MKRLAKISFAVIIACLLFVSPLFFLNKNDKPNPAYSQEYIDYLNTEDKSIYGDVVPSLFELASYEIEPLVSIPSYYCLRDDIMIYTTYQAGYGLCWAYTCNIALETMIAKNYNEFYNFSASWIGLTTKYFWDNNNYSSYQLGGGGNIHYYKYAVENYGLMLQSDFDLKDFYAVDSNNYIEVYNKHSSKAINNLGFDFEYVTYSNSPSKETLKSHILTNGALYAAIASKDIVNETYLCSLSGSTDHAVSIIGWDDDYTVDGWSSKGAWIALNSWGDDWGNNGIFYISYNDVFANSEMFGFIPKEMEKDKVLVETSSSSSDVDNFLVNKYSSSKPTTNSQFDEQFNIFEEGEPINIEYSYLNADNLREIEITISKDEQIVNSSFSNNTIDYSQKLISLNSSYLPDGTYNVDIKFIFNNDKTQIVKKAFTVFDGLELDSLYFSSDLMTDYKTTKQSSYILSNFNSFNKEDLYFEIYANSYSYIRFFFPTYSKIKSYSYSATSGSSCEKSDADFLKYKEDNKTYSRGSLYFSINISKSTTPTSFASFTFTNDKDSSKTYHFTIYNQNYHSSKLAYSYASVDYNGADGSKYVPSGFAVSSNTKTYVKSPTKTNASFGGWFTSPDFSEESRLPNDSTGYYLTSSIVKSNTGSNYMLSNFYEKNKISIGFNYIHLYAKWTIVKYSITYSWTDINGQQQNEVQEYYIDSSETVPLKQVSTLAQKGYEFAWESGYTNIDYINGFIYGLDQNIKIIGRYIPKSPIVTTYKIGNEQTSNLNTIYNEKDSYTMFVSVSHEASNVNFIYTWKKKDNSGIYKKISASTSNSLTVNKASHSGEYICEVVARNSTLGSNSKPTTSSSFVIIINKADTIIDTSSIITEYTYDGQYHEINGATINHNELNDYQLTYINNSFKDVGTGTKRVTIISRETENYNEAVVNLLVRINKAKITIKIDNKRGAVFAEKQPYTYTTKFGEIYGNDDLNLEFKSNANIYLAGEYEITAEAKNTNYEVEVLNGTYSVYIEGLSLVLIVTAMAIVVALACLIVYFILKKRSNDRFLKSSDFDDDIRF